ncbi:MAG: 4Fe-4S binding protein [Halothiobacillaceae bacterium]|jgi:ferredoxin|nr:4Fe-4S binding protein [Halothiobacillaceae bacterium]
MALAINELCVNCYACEPLCPNSAIYLARPHFRIDPALCTECLGEYDAPQCAEICPIEAAIIDEAGEALNPPGSLTGIPLQALAAAASALAGTQAHLPVMGQGAGGAP